MSNTNASWLCKSASSQAVGNVFYACGHATGTTLIESREDALRAAKREFHAFCDESFFCKDKAYNLSPLRTDCEKVKNLFSCYRGIQYTILDEKRDAQYISKREISDLIEEQRAELKQIKRRVADLEDANNPEFDTLDTKEIEYEYTKEYKYKEFVETAVPSAFSVLINGTGVPSQREDLVNSKNVFLAGIGFEFNRRVYKAISLRAQLIISGSIDNDEENEKIISQRYYHSYRGRDINIGIPIQFDNLYVIPTFGTMSLKYKSTLRTITQQAALVTTTDEYKYNSTYLSVDLRYGRKFFLEVSPRQYLDNNKFSTAFSVGINFGY